MFELGRVAVRSLGMVVATIAVFLLVTSLWNQSAAGAGTSGSQAFVCSIDSVAAYFGISMTPNSSPVSSLARAQIDADLAGRAPGATIVAERVSDLRSAPVPMLDGHRAVVRQVDGMPNDMILGPLGQAAVPARVSCGVAFYDADTGAFLTDYEKLEPLDSTPAAN